MPTSPVTLPRGPWWLRNVAAPTVTVALVAVVVGVAAPHLIGVEALDTDVYVRAARNLLTRPDFLYAESYPIRPYTYPPFSAALFTALLAVPVGWRTMALTVVSVVALHGVVRALLGRLFAEFAPRRVPDAPYLAVPVTLACLGAEPVFRNVVAGQVNLLVLPLTFFAVVAARPGWGGVLVGLAAGFKVTPAVFIVWFLATRRWRDVVTCPVAFLGTVAVGALAAPSATWAYWTGVLFDDYRVGSPTFVYNQSAKGALLRFVGPDMPDAVWWAGVTAVATVAGWALWKARRDALRGYAVIAVAGLLVSPISWSHHWVMMLPALTAVAVVCRRTARRFSGYALVAVWLVVMYTQLIWVGESQNDLEYVQPFLIKLAQASYTLLGVTTLTWLAHTRCTPDSPMHAPLTVHR